jgi:hypothetical protein
MISKVRTLIEKVDIVQEEIGTGSREKQNV